MMLIRQKAIELKKWVIIYFVKRSRIKSEQYKTQGIGLGF